MRDVGFKVDPQQVRVRVRVRARARVRLGFKFDPQQVDYHPAPISPNISAYLPRAQVDYHPAAANTELATWEAKKSQAS